MRLIFLVISLLALVGCDDGGGGAGGGGGAARDTYPVEGIGKAEGAVLANLAFETPDGEPLTMEGVFKDPSHQIMLVSTSAGWCTACIEEQPKLVALHEEFAARGLFILITLFEDDQFGPASARLAAQWKERYGLPFDVVADPAFQFGDYYNRELTPMTMLVDVDTMKILKISTGFPESEVRAILNAAL